MFTKILVPIDIAEPALAELGVALAAELAACFDGTVRTIHVLSEFPPYVEEFLPAHLGADREKSARSILSRIVAKADIPAGRLSGTVRAGVVYHEVLTEARAWGADLVIVGSRNPSVGTYLLGSDAEKIVRHAECSVLVARAHEDRHGTCWLVPRIAS